jgi:hypothetical protein
VLPFERLEDELATDVENVVFNPSAMPPARLRAVVGIVSVAWLLDIWACELSVRGCSLFRHLLNSRSKGSGDEVSPLR